MSCFSCFGSQTTWTNCGRVDGVRSGESGELTYPAKKQRPRDGKEDLINGFEVDNVPVRSFTFRDLATATKNFSQECLIGEGGFGRVYKGTLASTGQIVAVKQLDRNGVQGNKQFLEEVTKLSHLHHENLVDLIGYCADGDQRLLVYEFIIGGSLQHHLFQVSQGEDPLDWFMRMRIALGTAQGLAYLHDRANPPVIYRDLKPSSILLDGNKTPKLSDFGLAKLGPMGDKIHITSRVMGTYGYCSPEYTRGGQLSLKSDVYSFGVILLELITGRRAMDTTKPINEQNLVAWAQPVFGDPKKFPDITDPLLHKKFPQKDLNQAVAIAAMCLQEEPSARPLMADVVTTLSFLSTDTHDTISSPLPPSTPIAEEKSTPTSRPETETDSSNQDEDDSPEDTSDTSSDHNKLHSKNSSTK